MEAGVVVAEPPQQRTVLADELGRCLAAVAGAHEIVRRLDRARRGGPAGDEEGGHGHLPAKDEHALGVEAWLDRHGVHHGGQVDERDIGCSRPQPFQPLVPGDRGEDADVKAASVELAACQRRVQRRVQPGQSAGAVGREHELAHVDLRVGTPPPVRERRMVRRRARAWAIRRVALGSRASRSPSPNRLKARTVRVIATPGAIIR